MVAWLPVVKAVLPYLGPLVHAAAPAFTKRRDASFELITQQIAELQGAATKNAEAVKVVAEQLELTVKAIESAAETTERALRRAYVLAVGAALLSVIALAVAIAAP